MTDISAQVEQFLASPIDFFDMSFTKVHSIDRSHLLELQAASLSRRFDEQVASVPMVEKLAAKQGIVAVDEPEAIPPMLFEHTVYKSYPVSLLERWQYDLLTNWLSRLTSSDLSAVVSGGCDSIDSWIAAVVANSDLEVGSSSGTSGTMSFFPWGRADLIHKARAHRVSHLQRFGEEPSEAELSEPYHYIRSPSRTRTDDMDQAIAHGIAEFSHLRLARKSSADLLWLAARLRLAAARGDRTRVSVPEALLARRAELEAAQAYQAEADRRWLGEVERLQGERVLWVIFPPDWLETAKSFLNARVLQGYGMSELSSLLLMCREGRYPLPPWIIPILLDFETSAPLPREGVQVGRFALFDLVPRGHWGGLISGDEVEVDFDGVCQCGATTQTLGSEIGRLSERSGGDDKITCAATPQAHTDAMQFLTGF